MENYFLIYERYSPKIRVMVLKVKFELILSLKSLINYQILALVGIQNWLSGTKLGIQNWLSEQN